MSNPGVIILAKKNNISTNILRFEIEDNVGESIHIHLNNFRFDFTIDEFLDFSTSIRDAFNNLQNFKGFDLSEIDFFFLYRLSPFIANIKSINHKNFILSELRCYQSLNLPLISIGLRKKISNSDHYKYLAHKNNNFIEYKQDNYFNINNVERLKNIQNVIRNKISVNPLVIFYGENLIRDGLHRAAVFLHLYGENYAVKCKIIKFNSNTKAKYYLSKLLLFSLKLITKIHNIFK